MTDRRTSVVVIGGGYAGAIAANRLQRNPDVDITLLNPRPMFVQRLRLHQLAAGTGDATADFGPLLGDRVRLVVDSATRIEPAASQVLLASGGTLGFDYVVYAVGSVAAATSVIPGAAQFAYPLAEFEDATRLRAAIDELGPGAPVVVVGAGLTGVEVAAELAEQGHEVSLVGGGRLAPTFSAGARKSVGTWLIRHGVEVLETASVTGVQAGAVELSDGAVRPSALTVWAAGFGVPDLAARSGLSTDPLGRLLTDETLTSVDDHRIVGAGDAVSASGVPLRMSCYTAVPTGAIAAETILSRIANDAPAVLDLVFSATNVGLGRRCAVGQPTRKDDTAVNIHLGGRLGGRLAGSIKEAVTKGTLWSIRREARKPGVSRWPGGAPRRLPSTPSSEVVPDP